MYFYHHLKFNWNYCSTPPPLWHWEVQQWHHLECEDSSEAYRGATVWIVSMANAETLSFVVEVGAGLTCCTQLMSCNQGCNKVYELETRDKATIGTFIVIIKVDLFPSIIANKFPPCSFNHTIRAYTDSSVWVYYKGRIWSRAIIHTCISSEYNFAVLRPSPLISTDAYMSYILSVFIILEYDLKNIFI